MGGSAMGTIKEILSKLNERWNAEMPVFFGSVVAICTSVSAVALAVHIALVAASANEPAWWQAVYPYLIGIPAGMAAIAKLTKK